MNTPSPKPMIDRAKKRVVEIGAPGKHLFVCRDHDGGFEILNAAEYAEFGSEQDCVAAVWSYRDGDYNERNEFVENGRIAAACETY